MAGMRSQPQGLARISRTSTLARGLVGFWLPSGGGFVSAVPGIKNGVVASAATVQVLKKGRAIGRVSGNGVAVTIPRDARWQPTGAITLIGEGVTVNSNANGSNYWMGNEDAGGGFGFYASMDNTVHPYLKVGGAFADKSSGIGLGVAAQVGMTFDGATFYTVANGAQGSSQAISGSITNAATDLALCAINSTAGSSSGNGSFCYLAIWNRALSPAELASFYANPWQLIDDQADDDEMLLASGGAGATATPQGVSAAASVGTVSASAGAQAAPAGVSAAASVGVAVGSAGASTAPVGVTASASVGTVTATAGARATPAGVGAAGQIGAPVASGGAAAAPAGVSASASVGAATATGGSASTAFPAGVTASASVGAPVASAGATAAPAGVGALAQVGTATATGGSASTAAPAGVSATASVGQASATGGASAAPMGVTATASVGTASATAGSSIPGTATPAGVGAAASVGAAIGSGGAGCSPAGVAAFASVGAVIAAGEIRIPGTASPAGVTAYARVGTVTATGGGVFARAPAGNGYSPRRIETQSRPASIQRNNR